MADRPSQCLRDKLTGVQQAYGNGLLSLAVVTHAANFHKRSCVNASGVLVTSTVRDAAGVAQHRPRLAKDGVAPQCSSARGQPQHIHLLADCSSLAATRDRCFIRKRPITSNTSSAKRRRLAAEAESETTAQLMSVWEARLRLQLRRPCPHGSAAGPIEAVKARVVARATS